MLREINDSLEDAHRLVQLLKPIQCKVNLIAFNAHKGTRFQPSSRDAMLSFRCATERADDFGFLTFPIYSCSLGPMLEKALYQEDGLFPMILWGFP